eukprot:743397-Rhodomonas_salina.2
MKMCGADRAPCGGRSKRRIARRRTSFSGGCSSLGWKCLRTCGGCCGNAFRPREDARWSTSSSSSRTRR